MDRHRKCATCRDKVSRVDPEHRFCAEHRICVFIVDPEKHIRVPESEEKYLDFVTFSASLIL